MRDYETMVVFVPNLPEEEVQSLISRIENIIKEGGELVSIEEIGIKTLAYKINNQYTEGFYVLFTFKAGKEVLDNLEHFYKITDAVIRDIIVKLEK